MNKIVFKKLIYDFGGGEAFSKNEFVNFDKSEIVKVEL